MRRFRLKLSIQRHVPKKELSPYVEDPEGNIVMLSEARDIIREGKNLLAGALFGGEVKAEDARKYLKKCGEILGEN